MESIESLLVDQLRARNRQYRLAAALLIVFGAGAALAFASGWIDPTASRRDAKALVYGTLALPIALGFFAVTLREPRRHAAIVACTTAPSSVVWCYLQSPVRRPWMSRPAMRWMAADTRLWLGLADGTLLRFPVRFGDEARVTQSLRATLPTATFGYSEAHRRQFRQQPASLRSAAG